MDPGLRTPLVDFFRRREVARDVRLLAAQGVLVPRALEQLALLVLLSEDPDRDVAVTAAKTLERLPIEPLRAFLARSDVPAEIRRSFSARKIEPATEPAPDSNDPILETPPDSTEGAPASTTTATIRRCFPLSRSFSA